jgi:hypothetical protein
MEQVEGVGYGESKGVGYGESKTGRAGTIKMYCSGKEALFIAMPHVTVGVQHSSVTTLYKGSIAGV